MQRLLPFDLERRVHGITHIAIIHTVLRSKTQEPPWRVSMSLDASWYQAFVGVQRGPDLDGAAFTRRVAEFHAPYRSTE